MTNNDDLLFFNGINGATGQYGLTTTVQELAEAITSEKISPPPVRNEKKRTRGTVEGVDNTDLSQTGWGIIFATSDPDTEAIKEALTPLLKLREEQTGGLFCIFNGSYGYRKGESKATFLTRHNVPDSGAVEPERGMPYYLLIIGSPELIPYEFQYQLDVQFATGRLDFDKIEDYAHYANTVVVAKHEGINRSRKLSLFGVTNDNDRTTQASTEYLIQPLYDRIKKKEGDFSDWEIEQITGNQADRATLEQLLTGAEAPSLLFTASHGMEFPKDDKRQISHQGALLCSDWPGEKKWGHNPVPEQFYFAGEHLSSKANLQGLISFHFACYGAGSISSNDFERQVFQQEVGIASKSFIASLPKRMLNRPRGGALAVIGHVERAWGSSFIGERSIEQTQIFQSTLERLLKGCPVGYAMEYFNQRYAELSSDLLIYMDRVKKKLEADNPRKLIRLWAGNKDARNYIIIGDPAVCLPPSTGTIKNPLSAISNQDWQKTPLTVQAVVVQLKQRLERFESRIDNNTRSAKRRGVDVIERLSHIDTQPHIRLNLPPGDTLTTLQAHLNEQYIATYIKAVPADTPADFQIVQLNGMLEIQNGDGKLLAAPFSMKELIQIGAELIKIVHYKNSLKLQNNATNSKLVGAISLAVKKYTATETVPFETNNKGETIIKTGERIVIELSNSSDYELYVTVFIFAHNMAIDELYPGDNPHTTLSSGQTHQIGMSKKLRPRLPEQVTYALEYIKVIATMEDTNFHILRQEAIKAPYENRDGTISDRGASPVKPVKISIEDDWTTDVVNICLTKS